MYQVSYAEVLADNPVGAREQERHVLDRAITLLRIAETAEPAGAEEQEALTFVSQVWSVFIKDLAHPDNDLPAELRAQLMSIGLGILSEVHAIHIGQSRNLGAIADICATIRDGLY